MPVCADPNDTAPLYLKSDLKIPEADRPTFRVKFLTDSELRKLRRLLKSASEEKDEDKSIALVNEALRIGIVAIENVKFRGEPLTLEQIKLFNDHFTGREVWELAYGQIEAITVAENDRFLSASQPESDSALSAPDAADQAANQNQAS